MPLCDHEVRTRCMASPRKNCPTRGVASPLLSNKGCHIFSTTVSSSSVLSREGDGRRAASLSDPRSPYLADRSSLPPAPLTLPRSGSGGSISDAVEFESLERRVGVGGVCTALDVDVTDTGDCGGRGIEPVWGGIWKFCGGGKDWGGGAEKGCCV